MKENDTIFALATPVGGAIAIIRVSGPMAEEALRRLFIPSHNSGAFTPFTHRQMTYGSLIDPVSGGIIDTAMACYFQKPHSYTGEDMAEIHIHGGKAVVKRAFSAMARFLRPANGGEFTQRAFLNGKLELSQAEAVMDVISASTVFGAKSAAEQLAGSVGKAIFALEEELLDSLSALEAALDYPDELEEETLPRLPKKAASISKKMELLIEGSHTGRIIREGAVCAIIGAPNSGKSSLFNALLGLERAIVTPLPGTTRDTLEETLDIGGAPVRMVDTAGLRQGRDEVERIGIERAKAAIERADILLIAIDGTKPLDMEAVSLLEETKDRTRIILITKADLTPTIFENLPKSFLAEAPVHISSATGFNLDLLKSRMERSLLPFGARNSLITNSRHARALIEAKEALDSLDICDGADCAAACLRSSLSALGQISGREVSLEVVERIFSRFCVGK